MNKIRKWVLAQHRFHCIFESDLAQHLDSEYKINVCILPFTYYYMPGQRSALSNALELCIFIIYILLWHSQGSKIITITIIVTAIDIRPNLVTRVDI